jgi:hypothetical protein
MDLCNCIWRNRPFNKLDRNSRGFQLEEYVFQGIRYPVHQLELIMSALSSSEIIDIIKEICGEQAASCFSLTHLSALAVYSKKCFQVRNTFDLNLNIFSIDAHVSLFFAGIGGIVTAYNKKA